MRRGERIAQLVVAPVTRIAWREVAALRRSDRGDGGFGSTGQGGGDDRALHAAGDGARSGPTRRGSQRWLEVELALVDELAARGEVPREAARTLRARRARRRRAHAGDRGRGAARRHRVRVVGGRDASATRAASCTSGSPRATSSTPPSRCSCATRPICCSPALDRLRAAVRAQARAPQAHADDRPHARHPRRADHVRPQVRELVRGARPRPARAWPTARDAIALRQALGRGRHVRQQRRPRSRPALLARLGLAPEPIATQVVPRDRHAQFFTPLAVLAGTCERIATEIRHLQRTEVRRGARAVRRGPEGLVGDAAQAQPDPHRERLRPRAPGARLRAGGAREHGALARARHQPLVGRARDRARRDHRARLHARAPRRRGRGPRGAARGDGSGTSTRLGGAIFSEQVLLALVRQGVARDDAYRLVQRHALAGDDLARAARRRSRRSRAHLAADGARESL